MVIGLHGVSNKYTNAELISIIHIAHLYPGPDGD